MKNLSGRTLHGYEIREQIGAGGYGAVFRAYQTAVRREVAVKVILPEFTSDPQFAQSFAREARLIAQLEHPYIVPLHDFWQDDDGAFLVMRLLKGGSLRDLIKKHEVLPPLNAARILNQLADALAIAHSAGIIHRDLKPANILLDERGNAYLSDFGIAKDLGFDPYGDTPRVTSTEGMKGTPAYLSPEQIMMEPVTPQTDIYSLGIVLFEMLTGELPFEASAPLKLLLMHVNDPVPLLATKRPELPEALDGVLAKATAKDPTERYPDVQALAAEFREALNLSADHSTGSLPIAIVPTPLAQSAPLTAEDPPAANLIRKTVEVLSPLISTPPTSASPEVRNRANMLRNVRAFWIDGVLEKSLHGVALLELGLMARGDAVDNPWEMVLRQHDSADEPLPQDTRILDVYDRSGGALLLLGEPGSGKTTTLLELARDLLDRAVRDPQHPIPVVFNLSSWAEDYDDLAEWLTDELSSKYQVPRRVAVEWVEQNTLLLLLDGLDEVALKHREDCATALNLFRETHGFIDLVVCSRIADYELLDTRLKLHTAVVLQPLDDAQIAQYLNQFGSRMDAVRLMLAEDTTLRQMSRSPLMLSILTLAYQGINIEDLRQFETLEARRNHLLDVYVLRMFDRRGDDLYARKDTLRYLRWLARQMRDQALSVFEIENLQPEWLTAQQRNWYQTFFQFTLIMISGLLVGLMALLTSGGLGFNTQLMLLLYTFGGIATGWALGGNFWKLPGAGLIAAGIFGVSAFISAPEPTKLSWGVATGSLIAVCYSTGIFLMKRIGVNWDKIVSVELLHFARKDVNGYVGLLGLLAGCGSGLLLAPINAPFDQVLLAMIGSGGTALLFGLILSGLTSNAVGRTNQPNEGMRRSARNAVRMTLIIGVALFLVGFFAVLPTRGVTFAFFLGIFCGVCIAYLGMIVFGGYSLLQHGILRAVLQQAKAIPRNYTHFLDSATALTLMRKVGGGYIFIHRYLLEYFADQASEP